MDENAIREHLTEIGRVMEDASVIALIWRIDDGLSLVDWLSVLLKANRKIANLLNLIADQVS